MIQMIKEAVNQWEITIGTVVTGVLTAGLIGSIATIISMQTTIAAMQVRISINTEHLAALRSGTDVATASRYRREDAQRDIDAINKRIDEYNVIHDKAHTRIEDRFQYLEKSLFKK
jgi:hypothetical protein